MIAQLETDRTLKNCTNIFDFFESLKDGEDIFYDDKKNRMCLSFTDHSSFILSTDEQFDAKSQNEWRDTSIENRIYTISDDTKISIKKSFLKSPGYFDISKFIVSAFATETDTSAEDGYFRLIMKYDDKIRIDHHFEQMRSIYTDLDKNNWNGFEIKVDSNNLLAYFSGDYFIIECDDKINQEYFTDIARCILAGLSFITGKSPGNYAYIFRYDNNEWKEFTDYAFDSSFTKSINNSNYSVVNSNPYLHCQDLKGEEKAAFLEKHQKDFKGINTESFSKLCTELHNNSKFADGIHSIIEARQASLIAMGILYSVSLETLSALLTEYNKETTTYIKDKPLRKKLQRTLKSTAKKFFEDHEIDVPFEGSPIEKKINNINSSTNAAKLSVPFGLLNIPLLDDDPSIINKRNDFLHGNQLYNSNDEIDMQANDLWFVALRLSFLVNALVLKHVGHTGYICNSVGLLVKHLADSEKTYRAI